MMNLKKYWKKGGFISAHWDGTSETEEKVKNETKATIRCIPFGVEKEEGKCMVTGKPSAGRVLFAKSLLIISEKSLIGFVT